MRAVVYEHYGPPEVLRVAKVERPVPRDDEVLVRIHATTVTRSDCGVREANASSGPLISLISRLISGVRRPKQPILRKGRTILVYGASGSIGTAGVQLAKSFGADVTGVCSARNVEIVRSLGADRVIDYTREDFTKNGETYDVIFDAVGKQSFSRCRASLKPGGIYLPTDGMQNLILAPVTSRFTDKKVMFVIPPRFTKKDTLFLKELIEAGKYRAVIDRTYALEDIVEATKYVETQRKVGNVVLTVV